MTGTLADRLAAQLDEVGDLLATARRLQSSLPGELTKAYDVLELVVAADRCTVERHRRTEAVDPDCCAYCFRSYPCPDLTDRAAAWGVE